MIGKSNLNILLQLTKTTNNEKLIFNHKEREYVIYFQ